jgi:hypothetical protein
MLALAAVVVVLSFALDVVPPDRVALRGLHRWPLPQLCLSRAWFGLDCPGCGLTRSFIYLAHGRWSASLHVHRLGWLFAAAVVVQFPYRLLSLRRPDRPLLPRPWPRLLGLALITSLILNWLLGLLAPLR